MVAAGALPGLYASLAWHLVWLGMAASGSCRLSQLLMVIPYVSTGHDIDDLLGNVRGMVGNARKVP